MKRIVIFIMLCLTVKMLGAQEVSKELTLLASTIPETKLGFTIHFRYPFLEGEGELTKDNNIDLGFTAEISPISVNGLAEAVWTPVAFIQFAAGGRIGSGWNISLFGSDVYGIGINRAEAGTNNAEHSGSAFDGLIWKAKTGAALQFDLAALYPGDWHHVVARSYHEINYSGYTRAKAHESWYFENDDGENCNGFSYYGNLIIGYQMPVLISMVALLAEADLFLYDTPDRSDWRDDKIRWTFSGIADFKISEQLNITLIAQFRTRKNYLGSGWEDTYYRKRTIDSSRPQRLEFYRIAAALSYKF